MEDKTKNYLRGIICMLIASEQREEVVKQIYEQTEDLKNICQIELITKGILLKYNKQREHEGKIVRVSKDISEFMIEEGRKIR